MPDRREYEYLTVSLSEEATNLIGVRASPGNNLEKLYHERREHGQYRKKWKSMRAYTRLPIARVTLGKGVGFIGKSHVVMMVHLHHYLANLGLGSGKLAMWWDSLAGLLRQYDVKVLMGDFNMAFFQVIPQLRSRGVEINLAAWYPWKSDIIGSPMADSGGIFMVNLPGDYRLATGLESLHDRDSTGILAKYATAEIEANLAARASASRSTPAVAGRPPPPPAIPGAESGFDVIASAGGPGQALSAYLPKGAPGDVTLRESLTLSDASRAAVAAWQDSAGKPGTRGQLGVKFKEKRLPAAIWKLQGIHQQGSHFPICVFSDNIGTRSAQAHAARNVKARERKANKKGKGAGKGGAGEPQLPPPAPQPQHAQPQQVQQQHAPQSRRAEPQPVQPQPPAPLPRQAEPQPTPEPQPPPPEPRALPLSPPPLADRDLEAPPSLAVRPPLQRPLPPDDPAYVHPGPQGGDPGMLAAYPSNPDPAEDIGSTAASSNQPSTWQERATQPRRWQSHWWPASSGGLWYSGTGVFGGWAQYGYARRTQWITEDTRELTGTAEDWREATSSPDSLGDLLESW